MTERERHIDTIEKLLPAARIVHDYGTKRGVNSKNTLVIGGHVVDEEFNGGGQVAVAFTERSRAEGRTVETQEELAYPLTSEDGGNPHSRKIAGGFGVRRLTPTECERLQGFSDGWTEGQADSVRYRQLGNAVAVPVAEWIARRIASVSPAR